MKNVHHTFRLSMIFVMLMGLMSPLYAQDEESLKSTIQKHYTAIHNDSLDEAFSHHLPEFTMFLSNGHALWESGSAETAEKMGAKIDFGTINVTMKHFSAQIYGNVGIATFYLDGIINDEAKTTRVSAVWVWKDGEWKEAHHHESPLKS